MDQSSIWANNNPTEIEFVDHHLKQERLEFFVRLTERCIDVLTELDNPDLRRRYALREPSGVLDFYLFTYQSSRTLLLEVMASFSPSQIQNADTYSFTSHPDFERIVEKYTKNSKKPNPVLQITRPWDVALNMVMKVEAIEPNSCDAYRRLLSREHAILEHIWHTYLTTDVGDFDEMTGIPMLFDYKEVPSDVFVLPVGYYGEELNLHGQLVPWSPKGKVHTLAYMTTEKLGPNLSYLIDLVSVSKRQPVGLKVHTAFKIFDQLMCRLLQLHRFGVIHNNVCPQNVYFGRGLCYNVIYLNNFRSATLASSQRGVKPGVNIHVVKDMRFASLNVMKSRDLHPVDDIESAFYTLLACIGSAMPWDTRLQAVKFTDGSNNINNAFADDSPSIGDESLFYVPPMNSTNKNTVGQVGITRQFYNNIKASKKSFWNSSIYMERYIANLMHRLSDREIKLFHLIAGILQDLYTNVKHLLTDFADDKNSADFCIHLRRGGRTLHYYTDLRRLVLMYFHFERVPTILTSSLSLRNWRAKLIGDATEYLFGWNLSEWCFSAVEIRPTHAPVSSKGHSA